MSKKVYLSLSAFQIKKIGKKKNARPPHLKKKVSENQLINFMWPKFPIVKLYIFVDYLWILAWSPHLDTGCYVMRPVKMRLKKISIVIDLKY